MINFYLYALLNGAKCDDYVLLLSQNHLILRYCFCLKRYFMALNLYELNLYCVNNLKLQVFVKIFSILIPHFIFQDFDQ